MASQGYTKNSLANFGLAATAALGLLLLSACGETGKSTDTGPIFYPSLPQLPRLQFLTTINTEKDIGGIDAGALFGNGGSSKGFTRPFDVSHEKGKIYVADMDSASIVVVDLEKKKFNFIQETEGGPFQSPMGIFVDADGHKYISDKGREQILVLDEADKFLRAYGKKGQFVPLATVADDKFVYVCDLRDSEIEVLDKESGNLVRKIGKKGLKDGEFRWPMRLAFDSSDGLYVTDFLNFRVQKLDRSGRFIRQIGENGTFPGATPRPKGIAVDRDGYLYVVDGAFELVQIFDSNTGQVLLGFAKFGRGPGSSWLPSGIDIDYDNLDYFAKYVHKDFKAKYLVYVVNQAGYQKLNVYAFGDWTGPLPKGAYQPDEEEEPTDGGN